jgi:hypothetical protein
MYILLYANVYEILIKKMVNGDGMRVASTRQPAKKKITSSQ